MSDPQVPAARRPSIVETVQATDGFLRLAGRGYRNAFPQIEQAVTGGKLKQADLTEKMTFFEAYGALAGAQGIAILEKMLLAKGMFAKTEDAETRACAAMALGKINSPKATEALQRATGEKDVIVRNAVSKAIRGGNA